MADYESLALVVAFFVVIAAFFLLVSFRIVREGELLVVFRPKWTNVRVIGPGIAATVRFGYRAVMVELPHGLVDTDAGDEAHRADREPVSSDVPGHPGLSIAEVCFAAALVASRRDPKARRATAEDFQQALRERERFHARGP